MVFTSEGKGNTTTDFQFPGDSLSEIPIFECPVGSPGDPLEGLGERPAERAARPVDRGVHPAVPSEGGGGEGLLV